MKAFNDRFVKAIKRDSGVIRLSTEVSKIRVEEGKAQGVTLRDGTEIDSGSVISNADYKKTFLNLLNPEVVPPGWYDAISKARQTGSIFQVCVGIDRGKADLSAFQKVDRIIYRRNHGKMSEGEGGLNWDESQLDLETFARKELEVSLWGKENDTLSPKGCAVIVIRAEAEYSHFIQYRSVLRGRVSGYQEYKNRLAHGLIREIEHLIPGFEKAILVMDVATPLTFEDQGGRSQGAVAGWSWDFEDFQDEKPKELIQTPVKRLYMAGYQAFSALFLGGVPTAMESGKRAARAVLEGASPIERILIPGVK